MKKLLSKLFVLSTLSIVSLASCNIKANKDSYFGDFSYNGIFLNEYATKNITVYEAKQLIKLNNYDVKKVSDRNYLNSTSFIDLSNETIVSLLSKYSSVTATTKYYINDENKEQEREDIYQGTDFLSIIESNNYEPFGQMKVKYLYVDNSILDYMETKNEEFINDKSNVVCPFTTPYTYHSNESNELIIQTHSFAELPASVNGGIGSAYREDCEILFDEEGKITFWQASLGIYTSTPTGTIKQGYIFSVNFSWQSK